MLVVDTRELCLVPWLELDADDRREVKADEPIGFEQLENSVVEDRLEALGYKE